MKRIATLFFSILLLFSLTACNVKENRNEMGGANKKPAVEEPENVEDQDADDDADAADEEADEEDTDSE